MNIQTVATNLRVTIAGKEDLLSLNQERLARPFAPDDMSRFATKLTVEFLLINIAELKRILQDVEQCVYIDRYHEGYDAGWEQAILKERG